ncbi:acyltransferase [Parabacteroides sp. FAFU027]|uniref:acyltransferase n=1 Tax=Parabacteroides sp. FAFU027 TaxID=2922715 RepID=UPI001FAF68FF|nr:acyltransferase family protein [Parabacteroides sp. FAFU027]
MQPTTKQVWIDNLRALATIGVVLLHSSGDTVLLFGKIPAGDWWIGDIYSGAVRYSVPIFIMLTGVLLLGKEYSLGVFFRKRFTRVLTPFLFWSLIYIAFDFWDKAKNGENILSFDSLDYILEKLQYGASFHFWYIYMLIGLYLFIPILGKWARNCTEKEMLYFLGIWLCAVVLEQPYFSDFHMEIDIANFSGRMGYLVLGYYLANKSIKPKTNNIVAATCIIIGIVITIIGTGMISFGEKSFNEMLYENLSPNVILFTIGVFLFFRKLEITNPLVIKLRNVISKYSFGIYLVHMLVLRYLVEINIHWNTVHPGLLIPVLALLCLTISTAIIYGLNKLPYGKYFAG